MRKRCVPIVEQIVTAVRQPLVVYDARERAHRRGNLVALDATRHRQHNANRQVGVETIAGHAAVARLEDMQWQRHPRKEYDMERKQRYSQQCGSTDTAAHFIDRAPSMSKRVLALYKRGMMIQRHLIQ